MMSSKHPVDEDRHEAHGDLVDQKQFGLAHQSPADGQHLLLPPEGIPALLDSPFGPDREKAVDPFPVVLQAGGFLDEISPEAQVLGHGQVRKYLAALRNHAHSFFDSHMRGRLAHVPPVKPDSALDALHQTEEGADGRSVFPAPLAREESPIPLGRPQRRFLSPLGNRRRKPIILQLLAWLFL